MSGHVLVVSHEASRTGAPRVAIDVLHALERAGWSTTVVQRWGGPLSGEISAAAGASCTEPATFARVALRRFRFTKPLANWIERRAVRRVMRRVKPDLVWANTAVAAPYATAALELGVPAVLHCHEEPEWAAAGFRRARLDLRADGLLLVGCSSEIARQLARLAGSDDHVAVLHSRIDVRSTSQVAARPPESAEPVVVACGTGVNRKGLDVFVDAAAIAADAGVQATWCWVGRCDEEADTGGVHMVGEVPDARPWIAAADVFVLPSRVDAFPLVVLEAMALSRAVVSSDLPGPAEQLGGTGLLFEPGDAGGLARTVAALLQEPSRAGELGEAAHRRCAELWDLPVFADEVARLTVLAVER